ncbi:MAG TPA: 2-phosphosulfolactate phosphatase [Dehalococcoidia bacterium]|nr:2-phosphosulfolactate phosphatase [Dehalococcoidia bacterium]
MRIDVALLPGQIGNHSRSVCVVVDVLRASSSIVTLFERGASPVIAANSIENARALHERLPGYLLCGEKNGLPPGGFDYGNSPAEFSCLDLKGRGAILATSNGTRMLAALARAPAVLVGCLLNRTAIAEATLLVARERGLDIAAVCSAAYGGSTFVIEDALGAGAIIDACLRAEASVEASDAARFAADAFVTAARDLPAAVASAYHARELSEAGFTKDVSYCARLDVSTVAPLLTRGEDGVLTLRARLPEA